MQEKNPAITPANSPFSVFSVSALSVYWMVQSISSDSSPLIANPTDSYLWKETHRHMQKYGLLIFKAPLNRANLTI